MGWNRKPIDIANEIATRIDDLNKKNARRVLKMVYDLSPIKTGRYKSNHMVSIGAPTTVFDARRRDYNRWYLEALGQINSSPRGAKIFIQNNLPYAPKIDEGSSTQAPTGVYKVAKMVMKL